MSVYSDIILFIVVKDKREQYYAVRCFH